MRSSFSYISLKTCSYNAVVAVVVVIGMLLHLGTE